MDKKELTRSIHEVNSEWTARIVGEMGCEDYYGAKAIADSHNAALAAEENKRADWNVVIEDLEKQLASEREKVKVANTQCKTIAALMQDAEHQLADYKQKAESMLDTSKRVNDKLRKQLADERERANAAELEVDERGRTIIYYKQQLAAEREKVREKSELIQRMDNVEKDWESSFWSCNTENEQLLAQVQTLVDALKLCVNTLRDKRIGTVDYMEGSRIYSDFRIAVERGEAALAKVKEGK